MLTVIRYNLAKEIWQARRGPSRETLGLWLPLMHEERHEWGADGNAIDEAARVGGCEPAAVIQRGDFDPDTHTYVKRAGE